MSITSSKLLQAAGLSALLAGLFYIVRQLLHPSDDISEVSGTAWLMVGYMTLCMSVLGLAGVTGIYLRQLREVGLLGLIGYLMFSFRFVLLAAFSFAQTLILPPLVAEAPQFVDSFLGIFSGSGGGMSLGALDAMALVSAVLYIPGGLMFGIAIFGARILSRRGAGVLMWLGFSLWSQERRSATRLLAGTGTQSAHAPAR